MPIQDITGAASNAIGAYRDQGRVAAQQKATLMGGIADLGEAGSDAYAQKQMGDALEKAGLPRDLVRMGPHKAMSALLQRQREQAGNKAAAGAYGVAPPGVDTGDLDPSVSGRLAEFKDAASRQEAGFAHADASQERNFAEGRIHSGIGPDGAYDAGRDPALGRAKAEADEQETRDRAVSGEAASLSAPLVENPNGAPVVDSENFRQNTSSARPDEATIEKRFAAGGAGGKPFLPASRKLALAGAAPTPDPLADEERRAKIERDRAQAQKDLTPPAEKRHNIDPLSPEGQAATLAVEKGKAGLRAPSSWTGRESGLGASLRERALAMDKRADDAERLGPGPGETSPEAEAERASIKKMRDAAAGLWAEHDALVHREAPAGGDVAGGAKTDAAPTPEEVAAAKGDGVTPDDFKAAAAKGFPFWDAKAKRFVAKRPQ